jgi:glycosyltransferase involved in cell wall biosynthesis
VKRIYGIEADVLHPPLTIDAGGPRQQLNDVEPGYVLSVSRLLPYKNVDAVVAAFDRLTQERLVIVGEGPERARLQGIAGRNVRFVGSTGDAELRWLYANALCLVTASYEDFGLTPLEAAAFGKPTAALRFGGFLDTIRDGETGVFFERPEPAEIATALTRVLGNQWDGAGVRRHADSFSEQRFIERVRQVVREELAVAESS